jgi:hypothetical protein
MSTITHLVTNSKKAAWRTSWCSVQTDLGDSAPESGSRVSQLANQRHRSGTAISRSRTFGMRCGRHRFRRGGIDTPWCYTDQQHPLVHRVVKAEGDHGRRLHIDKAMGSCALRLQRSPSPKYSLDL